MTLSEIGDPVRGVAAAVQVRFQESDGGFEAPRGTGVVATVVGGGEGMPGETKGPESEEGVLETGGGGGGGGAGEGGGGEATGRVGGTGGAGRGAGGGMMGVVMAFVVVGMVIS